MELPVQDMPELQTWPEGWPGPATAPVGRACPQRKPSTRRCTGNHPERPTDLPLCPGQRRDGPSAASIASENAEEHVEVVPVATERGKRTRGNDTHDFHGHDNYHGRVIHLGGSAIFLSIRVWQVSTALTDSRSFWMVQFALFCHYLYINNTLSKADKAEREYHVRATGTPCIRSAAPGESSCWPSPRSASDPVNHQPSNYRTILLIIHRFSVLQESVSWEPLYYSICR